MSFAEVQFPVNISLQSKGGPGYNTNIVVTDGGSEERVARWSNAKRQFDVRFGIKSPDQLQTVIQFYIARQGAAFGFRYKDWLDYDSTSLGHHYIGVSGSVTNADQNIGTGDGTTTVFQLLKRYTDSGGTKIRNITKPVAGTTLIALNGVNQSSGFSVDTTTGLVTFTSAPGIGVAITAGFEFDVPVRFGDQADKVLMGSIEDFGWGNMDPIPLVELSDGLEVNDDANCGGAVEVCLSGNILLSAGYARAYIFEPQGAFTATLPNPSNLPTGGPMFWLANLGPSSVTVKTFAGATLVTLTANQAADIILTVDGGGAKIWYAV